MRYADIINEGMSFSAGHKDEKSGYWTSDTDSGSRYSDEFYKTDWPYDKEPPANPDYKEELDLHLSNMSMHEVLDVLGYNAEANMPIDEFIARATQWLQKNIGKPSPEVKPQVHQNPGGPRMISGGRPEGYYNRVIQRMAYIARVGKQNGATHVWAA